MRIALPWYDVIMVLQSHGHISWISTVASGLSVQPELCWPITDVNSHWMIQSSGPGLP